MSFEKLNIDAYFKILDYCGKNDLLNLCSVNKYFYSVIYKYAYYRTLHLLKTGHKIRSLSWDRNLNTFNNIRLLKINDNWQKGRYEEHIFFKHRIMYTSQLILEKQFLYMSHGGQIRAYRRSKSRILNTKVVHSIGATRDPDVTTMIKKNNTLFAGRLDGVGIISENDNINPPIKCYRGNDLINSVDFHNKLFVTTSLSSTKFWKRYDELGLVTLEPTHNIPIGFKTIKLNSDGSKLAGGQYIEIQKNALKIIDVNTQNVDIMNSVTRSIYDLLWKDENCIMTANFDTTFRIFDCRTKKDELIWTDPYESSVYTLDYDGLNAVLCGMKYHCRVNLYDLRIPNKFIQMYFPSLSRGSGSPVYSIASDNSQLFISTDHNLRVMDFNTNFYSCKDYSKVFVNVNN